MKGDGSSKVFIIKKSGDELVADENESKVGEYEDGRL